MAEINKSGREEDETAPTDIYVLAYLKVKNFTPFQMAINLLDKNNF